MATTYDFDVYWGRAVLAAAVIALVPWAPAAAASASSPGGTVVVRGTAFPAGRDAQLSFLGCADPYARAAEQPVPYVGIGPGEAPSGTRSLGYDLAGGNAIGSMHYVDSILATTVVGLSVFAPEGAAGVSYVGYQEPRDWGTGRVWFGRAELAAPAGGWSRVDVAGLEFTWTKYDMLAQRRLPQTASPSAVPAFVKARGGDGPGFFTVGFGCDGKSFNMDAWRVGGAAGVTTYDLEGLATSTTISGPEGAIEPGEKATLRGSVVDHTGAPVPGARLVLEVKGEGGEWNLVEGVDGANAEVTVAPERTMTFRFRFVDRPLAEGSASAELTVEVRRASGQPEQPEPPAQPEETPAKPEKPKGTASQQAQPSQQATPQAEETEPTDQPSTEPAAPNESESVAERRHH